MNYKSRLNGTKKSILIFGDEDIIDVQDAIEVAGKPVSEIIESMDKGELISPVTLWTEIINNPAIYDLKTRMQAAKDLSQFTHRKQPLVEEIHQVTDNKFDINFLE